MRAPGGAWSGGRPGRTGRVRSGAGGPRPHRTGDRGGAPRITESPPLRRGPAPTGLPPPGRPGARVPTHRTAAVACAKGECRRRSGGYGAHDRTRSTPLPRRPRRPRRRGPPARRTRAVPAPAAAGPSRAARIAAAATGTTPARARRAPPRRPAADGTTGLTGSARRRTRRIREVCRTRKRSDAVRAAERSGRRNPPPPPERHRPGTGPVVVPLGGRAHRTTAPCSADRPTRAGLPGKSADPSPNLPARGRARRGDAARRYRAGRRPSGGRE